jgi:hypothetical protein
MSPEVIAQLSVQVLRLINNIIEGIPVEQRNAWWRDNQKFWNDLLDKLTKGEFKLPDLKLPTLPGGHP